MDECTGAAGPEQSELRWVDPREILDSPFGNDVNIPAAEGEDEALEKSVAEFGVQNPIICKVTNEGKLQCLAGTRRLRAALKAGVQVVPVLVMQFDSDEAERQFAILDNLVRRQLTTLGKAKLGLFLWRSFKKSSGEKGKAGEASAREKAAIAASISSGTLFNFDFVLKYGDQETINAMQAESISIGAAYTKTKALIDGAAKETASVRSARANKLIGCLETTVKVLDKLPDLSELIANIAKIAPRCKAAEKARLKKQLAAARGVVVKITVGKAPVVMLDAIKEVEEQL